MSSISIHLIATSAELPSEKAGKPPMEKNISSLSRTTFGQAHAYSEPAPASSHPDELETPSQIEEGLERQLADSTHLRACESPQAVAKHLVGAITRHLKQHPGQWDMRALDIFTVRLIGHMGPMAWQRIQDYARSLQRQEGRDVQGITWIALPDKMDPEELEWLVPGLAAFDQLESVQVSAPPAGQRIDLRPLAADDGREVLVRVTLRPPQPAAAERPPTGRSAIWVAAGMRVEAAGDHATGPYLRAQEARYIVCRWDRVGEAMTSRTRLGGVFHHPVEATDRELGKNLNGAARLPSADASRPSPVMCRHLATLFALDRLAHLDKKRDEKARAGSPAPTHFSFSPYASAESIAWRMPADIQERYMAMLHPSRLAVVAAPESLPAALHDQFDAMDPGSFRQFMVHTGNHAMYLELQAKRAPDGGIRAYTVMLYDPNATVTAPRMDVTRLQDLRPEYLAPLVRHVSTYACRDNGVPQASLFLIQPLHAAFSRPRIYVPDAVPRDGRNALYWALMGEDLLRANDLCRQAIAQARSSHGLLEHVKRDLLLTRWPAKAYINHLRLILFDLGLDPSDRSRELSRLLVTKQMAELIHESGALAAISRLAVTSKPPRPLEDSRARLLHFVFDMFVKELERGAGSPATGLRPELLAGLYAVVHEIALAKSLTQAEKGALISNRPLPDGFLHSFLSLQKLRGPSLAAKAMHKQQTQAAVAIACAILDAALSQQETAYLLKQGLGLPVDQVLRKALTALRQDLARERRPLALQTQVRIAGLKEGPGWSWHTLRLTPVALDTNPELMVCTADNLPETLRMYLIDRESRPSCKGLAVKTTQVLLLVPAQDLHELAGTGAAGSPLRPHRKDAKTLAE